MPIVVSAGSASGPYATPEDVAARWRPLTPSEEIVASTLVDDASELIRAEFPGIDAQVDSGALSAGLLRIVVSNMVKRALIAPSDGVSQASEGTGPYSHSESYANPMRNIFLTEPERVLILGYRPAAFSTTFGNDVDPTTPSPNQVIYGW